MYIIFIYSGIIVTAASMETEASEEKKEESGPTSEVSTISVNKVTMP